MKGEMYFESMEITGSNEGTGCHGSEVLVVETLERSGAPCT
jgi:hypothetical protein